MHPGLGFIFQFKKELILISIYILYFFLSPLAIYQGSYSFLSGKIKLVSSSIIHVHTFSLDLEENVCHSEYCVENKKR